MAKLVEILARELKEWPEGAELIVQDFDGVCWPSSDELSPVKVDGNWSSSALHSLEFRADIAEDCNRAIVTRAQWKAERARIATTNRKATQEAREIAQGEKLPKRDSKLWDRAALAAFAGYCARPGMDAECAAEEAMFAADAFMNAMEKHLSSN